MKSIILCEGKTDLVLYSYYLCKVNGWRSVDKKENRAHKKSIESRLSRMKIEGANNQEFAWYFRGDDILCIYAVGSKDFSDGLLQVIAINLKTSEEKFSKVAVISDRDDLRSESEIMKSVKDCFAHTSICFRNISHNRWNESEEYDSMGETYSISLLPLMIPIDETGTIEIFMLNCRKEINEGQEETLINDICKFIDRLTENDYVKREYLSGRGIIPKAKLGAYFSVVSPNRTFDAGNKILESIPWENYQGFHQSLHLLSDI